MNSVTGILIFTVLITTALIIVSLANRVQTRKRVLRIKVKQLRTRINDLEDIREAITPLLESIEVPRFINKEVIDLIHSVIKLAPETSNLLQPNLDSATSLSKSFSLGINSDPVKRIQTSDAAIAKQQYYLNEAGKLIRRHQSLGHLEMAEMNACIRELSWAHLMVAVISQIAQGHQAVNRQDFMIAQGHYRSAQQRLQNSPSTEDIKHQLIRELSEILSGKRLSISTNIMPETDFNPIQKTDVAQTPQD